jgi:hypothetical protein
MSLGGGAITPISRKQSLNTRSSTEAELVAADGAAGPMLWTKQFLQAQGYPVMHNVLYQDNKSAILLETNGRESAGKRSRHLNIRMFFITDQVKKGNIDIQYCLHGRKFEKFRKQIMNPSNGIQKMQSDNINSGLATVGHQESVDSNESDLNGSGIPQSVAENHHDDGWTLVKAKPKSKAKGRRKLPPWAILILPSKPVPHSWRITITLDTSWVGQLVITDVPLLKFEKATFLDLSSIVIAATIRSGMIDKNYKGGIWNFMIDPDYLARRRNLPNTFSLNFPSTGSTPWPALRGPRSIAEFFNDEFGDDSLFSTQVSVKQGHTQYIANILDDHRLSTAASVGTLERCPTPTHFGKEASVGMSEQTFREGRWIHLVC